MFCAFYAQLNMRAVNGVVDAGQAKYFHIGPLLLDVLHQGGEHGFLPARDDKREFAPVAQVLPRGVVAVEHPLHHGPGHDGKAWKTVHMPNRKAWNAVERVRNDLRPLWQARHLQTLQIVGTGGLKGFVFALGVLAHTLLNQGAGLRVHVQVYAQRGGSGLAGMVIRRSTNAAAAQHHIAAAASLAQERNQARGLVTHDVYIRQTERTRPKQLNYFGNVLVSTPTREDFIAHHNQAKGGQGAVRRSVPQIEVSQPLQISAQLREEAVARAMLAINAPYRYGGSTLASGFDCSGLVFYVFGALVSQPMPRSTLQWARASLPVAEERLQRGDFVFFNTSGASFSHMGIYLGAREFVHAPSSGKAVRVDSLDSNYYAARFDGGRSAFAA